MTSATSATWLAVMPTIPLKRGTPVRSLEQPTARGTVLMAMERAGSKVQDLLVWWSEDTVAETRESTEAETDGRTRVDLDDEEGFHFAYRAVERRCMDLWEAISYDIERGAKGRDAWNRLYAAVKDSDWVNHEPTDEDRIAVARCWAEVT